jgi:hypothetical protein
MNTQTQQAFEMLMQDRNGALIADAIGDEIRTADADPNAYQRSEAENFSRYCKRVSWRLAVRVGKAAGANQFGTLSGQNQLDKVNFVQLVEAYEAYRRELRDTNERALLAKIRNN